MKNNIKKYDWQYILKIAIKHKNKLIIANVIAIFATLASIPVPLLLPLLVDEVLLKEPNIIVPTIDKIIPLSWQSPQAYILFILFLTLALRLISLFLNVYQTFQFTILAKNITFQIRKSLLLHLKFISMAEYENLGSGTVSSYFTTDLNTLDSFISTTISRLIIAIFSIIGVSVILLVMHWQIALLILIANPIVIYFTTILGKQIKNLKKNENLSFAVFQQSLIETLECIHQIRASNREKHYLKKIIHHAWEVKKHGIAFAWKSDAAGRLSFIIFLFGFDIFRAVAMIMVVYSDLSIGQMFAVFGYLWFMMSPVQEILNIQYSFYAAKAALKRINELLILKKEPKYSHDIDPFKNKRTVGITIDNLYFSYIHETNILKGVNLHIEPGEKIALVGASGAGKSTLVQTLIGLYPISKGNILYDETPIEKIGMDIVRENVATVLQNPALFNDSIRTNLTLGKDIDDKKLWQALEISQLRTNVEDLPNKLDTFVGNQGIKLSGGQKQRLAIARMILTDPSVVILDEATSALDIKTEYYLHEALSDFLKNKTTIIVAHRLSAIKQASWVYVFEEGQISEQGNHSKLLSQNGLYSKLYGLKQTF